MSTAIVVGSGPNGLAAAIVLAEQGLDVTVLEASDRIGGGARSSELTLPGLLHDDCSAFHPMGVSSPAFRSFTLDRHGLSWAWPEVDLAHPLDDAPAGAMFRSLTATADHLNMANDTRNSAATNARGARSGDASASAAGSAGSGGGRRADQGDGDRWRRLFGPPAEAFDRLAGDVYQPLLHVPRHPVALARFGWYALQPATWVARRWRSDTARALFAGIAAHAFSPLGRPLTSAFGMMLGAAGHAYGWPVARGGSQSITDSMTSRLTELGGVIETGRRVRHASELSGADVVMLDLAPRAVADIYEGRLPPRVARAYRRFRRGPGAYKVDLAIEGGIPWSDEVCTRAGTVHLGGTLEEIAAAELAIARGRMPSRPFVLVGQQYLADSSRSAGDVHPVWAYAHVPHGFAGDATKSVIDQIERFAPGTRERIVGQFVRATSEMVRYNPNYVGGDIATGANDPIQAVFRPRITPNPYSTGIPGVYICSAATPPGAGAHGMCGYNAATSALRHL